MSSHSQNQPSRLQREPSSQEESSQSVSSEEISSSSLSEDDVQGDLADQPAQSDNDFQRSSQISSKKISTRPRNSAPERKYQKNDSKDLGFRRDSANKRSSHHRNDRHRKVDRDGHRSGEGKYSLIENSEAYLKIVEYLKKIEWDQQNSQNKMNPFHFMTAQCFWFWVCAEYFSHDFFAKNDPQQDVKQIMSRVSKVFYPVPSRLQKANLAEKSNILEFQTRQMVKYASQLQEKLKQVVYTPQIDLSYDLQEKPMATTDIAEDDVFRSSTRALLYNYVKRHYGTRIHYQLQENYRALEEEIAALNSGTIFQGIKQQPKIQAQELLPSERIQQEGQQPQDGHKMEIEDKPEKEPAEAEVYAKRQPENYSQNKDQQYATSDSTLLKTEENFPVKQESPRANQEPLNTQTICQNAESSLSEAQNQSPKNQQANMLQAIKQGKKIEASPNQKIQKEELLLSTIMHLPLEKVISILASQIQPVVLPDFSVKPLVPASSDPFSIITQTHPLESDFFQYLKRKKRQENAESEDVKKKSKAVVQQHADIKCQICTDGDYTEDNLIVFCSTCNISLHQRCVGLAKVPSESWICDVCTAFGPKGRWLRCALCTVKGGALKRTNISSDTILFKETNPSYHEYLKNCSHPKTKEQYLEDGNTLNEDKMYYDYYDLTQAVEEPPDCHYVWVHYSCAIWVPECYFEERNANISIKGIETIDKKRFRLLCEICQTSRTGACVKCADEACSLYYHSECARKAGVYMEQRNIDRLQYFVYCNSHKPLKLTRVIESKSKKYRDEIVKFCRAIEKYIQTYRIANLPFRLLKSSKKGISKSKKEAVAPKVIKQTKEDRDAENKEFMRKLKQYLFSHRKLVIQLKKYSDTSYKVIDIEEPIKKTLRTNISKTDELWEFFSFKNLAPIQLFKRYKRIMKQDITLREEFSKELKSQTKAEKKAEKKKAKEAEEEYTTIEEDPNKLYCLCKRPYLPGEHMIQCQICQEWYHFKCIGFIGKEEDAEKVEFNCYRCQLYQDPIIIEMRRIKYKQYYDLCFIPNVPVDEDFQLLKPIPEDEELEEPLVQSEIVGENGVDNNSPRLAYKTNAINSKNTLLNMWSVSHNKHKKKNNIKKIKSSGSRASVQKSSEWMQEKKQYQTQSKSKHNEKGEAMKNETEEECAKKETIMSSNNNNQEAILCHK